MKFKVTDSGAYQVRGKGFMVSYLAKNPSLSSEDSNILSVLDAKLSLIGGTVNVPSDGETALCLKKIFPKKINAWFLLTGDFRKEYEGLSDLGAKACYDFWSSQVEEHPHNTSSGPLSEDEYKVLESHDNRVTYKGTEH